MLAMEPQDAAETRSKVLVIVGSLSIAVVALYFSLGMPGMDHGDSMSSMNHTSSTSPTNRLVDDERTVRVLDAARFAAETKTKNAVLVNVHVPFEGSIEGTQLSIPFDTVAEAVSVLPIDRDTPLLVYCRSGRMSKIATAELVRLGYRDVSDLAGGMIAWEASGRTLVQSEQEVPVG